MRFNEKLDMNRISLRSIGHFEHHHSEKKERVVTPWGFLFIFFFVIYIFVLYSSGGF